MASPSIKKSQPAQITGTTDSMTNNKANIRDRTAVPVRAQVPDDANHDQSYRNWQPGNLRPYTGVFVFNSRNPDSVMVKGPNASVGGKLNGIETCSPSMNSSRLFGKNGWSK
jgi:hypothetical protein